jgi:hypothetical protein
MLHRLGFDEGEDSGAQASPDLLMDMMEQREALAQTRATRNTHALAELVSTMESRHRSVIESLQSAFAQQDRTAVGTSVPPLLTELRFVCRFLQEARAVEDELL